MPLSDISRLVPHAKPMLIIDRALFADNESLTAELRIDATSLFCENGRVGAWIGLEYMAQAVAAHAGYLSLLENERVKPGMLLGTRNYQCICPSFSSGDTLHIHVKRLFLADNGLGSYECAISKNDHTLAHAVLTVFQPENPENFIQGGTS